MQRPRIVSIVAWTWIVFGVLLAVGGVLQAITAVSQPTDASASMLAEAPAMLALGLLGIGGAIGLLALRPRALVVLELLTWGCLAYMLWNTFGAVPRLVQLASDDPALSVILLAGQLPYLLWVAGLIILLAAIRGRRMRAALATPA